MSQARVAHLCGFFLVVIILLFVAGILELGLPGSLWGLALFIVKGLIILFIIKGRLPVDQVPQGGHGDWGDSWSANRQKIQGCCFDDLAARLQAGCAFLMNSLVSMTRKRAEWWDDRQSLKVKGKGCEVAR